MAKILIFVYQYYYSLNFFTVSRKQMFIYTRFIRLKCLSLQNKTFSGSVNASRINSILLYIIYNI